MNYTVQQLSRLTGLTPRTLRYYDDIGLLRPKRREENDYRLYGEADVVRLHRILRYREMGLALEEIGHMLEVGGEREILERHLLRLEQEGQRLREQMEKTRFALIEKEQGEEPVDFETMKQQVLRENEECYGAEIREKYGKDAVEESDRRITGMSQEQWDAAGAAEEAYLKKLKDALTRGDPGCEAAREACRLHLEWLRFYWDTARCVPAAHKGVVLMYDQDERFRSYYEEKAGRGCAAFFGKAILAYYE